MSWAKATDKNMRDYKDILSLKLQSIDVPTDVLVCGDIHCSNKIHFQLSNKYVADITESCISAAESVIPRTCRRQNSGRILLVGLSTCSDCAINHCSGIIYGWTVIGLKLAQLLIVCVALAQPITMPFVKLSVKKTK